MIHRVGGHKSFFFLGGGGGVEQFGEKDSPVSLPPEKPCLIRELV